MRAVIQRVTHASVTINGTVKSAIQQGFLILLGVCDEDTMEDVDWLVKKIANHRERPWWSVSSRSLPVTRKATVPHGSVPALTNTLSHSTRPSAAIYQRLWVNL